MKDGGGARGLSSLIVLKALMLKMRELEPNCEPLIPADHFDYIAGSGTGGACMLGRLRMPIDKAIEEYVKLMKSVFSEKKLSVSGSAVYKAKNLQEALGVMIREATGDEEEMMIGREGSTQNPKTAVFAMGKINMNACIPVMFRSYQVHADPSPDCTIKEALRATMAHPDLFKSVEIKDPKTSLKQSFVGGEIGCNNPIAHVLAEVKRLYPGRHVACILSIGAGHTRTIQVSNPSLLRKVFRTQDVVTMKQMATDSERVAEEMKVRFKTKDRVYFRFNVDQGMQSMLPGSWEQLNDISQYVRLYLEKPEVGNAMDHAIRSIAKRPISIETELIDGHIPGQVGKNKPSTRLKRCPAPTALYTGYDTQCRQLETCLTRDEEGLCICVIYGLGGVGKTQLALNVIERTSDKWDYVIYVDASSERSIKEALQDFAVVNQVGEGHEDAIGWLEHIPKRWLLVLDNADDRSLVTGIRQYIPRGRHANAIITTRLPDMAIVAKGVNSTCYLSCMDQEDGLALLLKTARMEEHELSAVDREAAVALLQDLGCHALAIVHAGAYMRYVHSVGIVKYRDLFLSERHAIMKDSGTFYKKIEQHGKSLDTTWKLCYELLQEPSKQMLWLMAFLNPRDIHEDLFKRAAHSTQDYEYLHVPCLTNTMSPAYNYVRGYLSTFLVSEGCWNTVRFADIMADLTSCSLVEFDRMNLGYNIHILVQDWVRTIIPQASEFALDCTATLVSESLFNIQDDSEWFIFQRQVWPHVNSILGHDHNGGEHPIAFSYLCLQMGEWDQAIRLAKKGAEVDKRLLGDIHIVTNWSKILLSLALLRSGQSSDSEKIATETLGSCKQFLVEGHPMTVESQECLSEIYAHQGRWDEAEGLQIQVLETYKRLQIPECPRVLASKVNLAQIYLGSAQWAKAEELWTVILDTRKHLGEEHPDLLYAMSHLAICFSLQGRHDEAERLQEQISKTTRRLWKGDHVHPRILESISLIALNHTIMGRLQEAKQLLLRVMEARKRLFGEEHPDTVKTIQRVAMAYTQVGQYDKAQSLLIEVIDISKRKLSANHPDTQLYELRWAFP
ncbi:Patatin-like phospholipase, partial [Rhizoctonia solani]